MQTKSQISNLKPNTMFGAIVGDIIGSRFEFSSAPQKGFELFTDECNFTDDTICTIAVADALIHKKDFKWTLHEWCRRYPHPMGEYGNRFYNWVRSDDPQPTGSYGNGAAMRVSSVGWLIDDYNEVLDVARQTAIVSHDHPEGIKGAQCVAALIYWLRTCRIDKFEVERSVKRGFGYVIPSLADVYKIGSEGHFDGTCQETVPMAIRCFLDAHSFEETIRLSVMAGGDTDTKTAIAGSIAEAYYDVPDWMIERANAYLPHEMSVVIEDFYNYMADKWCE